MRCLILIAVAIAFFVVSFAVATYVFKLSYKRRKQYHRNTPIRGDGLRHDPDPQPSGSPGQNIFSKDDL